MTQLQDDLASDLNQGSLAIKVARNLRNICRAQSVSVLQVTTPHGTVIVLVKLVEI